MGTMDAFRASSRRRSTANPTPKRKAKIPQAFCSTKIHTPQAIRSCSRRVSIRTFWWKCTRIIPKRAMPRRMSRVCRRLSPETGDSSAGDDSVGRSGDSAEFVTSREYAAAASREPGVQSWKLSSLALQRPHLAFALELRPVHPVQLHELPGERHRLLPGVDLDQRIAAY